MLVQYEDKNLPPQLVSTWSWQDHAGSALLVALAWVGLLIGVGGALYWARLSVLGAVFGSNTDSIGFAWLSVTAAGAAIIAPILWPFLKHRRSEIATFVLTVGIISWLLTSASGTAYLIAKSEMPPPRPSTQRLEAQLGRDERSIFEAEEDCKHGIWRGCAWLDSRAGYDTQARRYNGEQELSEIRRILRRPIEAADNSMFGMAKMAPSRFLLFLMDALGGAIALALIWGPAEALKGMWNEPGTIGPGAPASAVDGFALPLQNPIDLAFESWAAQCLERARGERMELNILHAHYVAWCVQRGLPAFASDSAFGRALNRAPDPDRPGDLGGPMVRHGAYPLKTGGRMCYLNVRLRPDAILDEIEGAVEG
jgi:hypothetical protein